MQPWNLKAAGKLSLDDLIRYQFYHSFRVIWPLMAFMVVVLAIAILGAIVFLIMSVGTDDFQSWVSNAVPFILMAVLWLFLVVGRPYLTARSLYRSQATVLEPLSFSFDAEGYSTSGVSFSGNMAWSSLHKIRETKSLYLLYQAPNMAAVLPKRFFATPAEVEQWKALVSTAFPKGISRTGILGKFC